MLRIDPAQQKDPDGRRVGVIDVGSNSIRLVVYDKLSRQPIPVFNEKVMCGLGRGMQETGALNPEGVQMALANLARFSRLASGMGVGQLHAVATAAVRDALDGAEFLDAVRRVSGLTLSIIDGENEARLSALGVLSGQPGADGVVGDLGGGSLELVGLDAGKIGPQVTLPVGALRLMGGKGARQSARQRVQEALASVPWLGDFVGRPFFPVGGAWRSVAKVNLAKRRHPVHIIQAYTAPTAEIAALAEVLSNQGRASLDRLPGVSKRRLETLPVAAVVLEEVLAVLRPDPVIFSVYGLREGVLFHSLDAESQTEDPLLAGCRDLAERIDRFGPADAIVAWTTCLAPELTRRQDRLRKAVCLISDIAWAEHPDYRAEHAYQRVLRLPVGGVDHAERVTMAAAMAIRYGASPDRTRWPGIALIEEADYVAATRIGTALRLAHTITGGVATMLGETRLQIHADTVELQVARGEADLVGDVVQRRLSAFSEALGRKMLLTAEEDPVAVPTVLSSPQASTAQR